MGVLATARSASDTAVAKSPASIAVWARVAMPMFDLSTLSPKIEARDAMRAPDVAQPVSAPIIPMAVSAVPKRSDVTITNPLRLIARAFSVRRTLGHSIEFGHVSQQDVECIGDELLG